MNWLRNLKIQQRLSFLLILSLLGTLFIIVFAGFKQKENLTYAKEEKTQHLVESSYSIINHFYQAYQSGKLTKDQAQAAALNLLSSIRYDETEYFWVNDNQANMVMHPIKPALNGENLLAFKDPNGKEIFKAFIQTARNEAGGFVYYEWPKPGSETPQPKVSYVKSFKAWGWIIGSGIYIDDIQREFTYTLIIFSGIGLLVTLIIGGVSKLISSSITSPIQATCEAMQAIAEGNGDLTKRLKTQGKDEVSELANHFNTFVEKIRVLASQVGESTNTLTHSAKSLEQISQQTSNQTSQQMMETNQVATAIHEMSTTVQMVAENAETAAISTAQIKSQVTTGQEVVASTSQSIHDLADEIDQAANTVDQLAQESESIGSVLDVIRAIAEQTNLLALNAAIEAARAGEQGRGFAVVADEVRTLASRTQHATQEIQTMIEHLQKGATEAVNAMRQGQQKSKDTAIQAQKAGVTLDIITQSIYQITDMNNQIATAVEEQTHVANEINRSICSIAGLADHVSNSMTDTESASTKQLNTSQKLAILVGQFKVC